MTDSLKALSKVTDMIPVPCKCCGQLHPACGCWQVANLDNLAGHLCYEPTERERKRQGLGLAWHPKYPGQQRSAIAFHIRQFEAYTIEYRIAQAAVWKLATDDPAYPVACKRASDSARLAAASLRFLDENDPTGAVHPVWLRVSAW